MGASCLGKMSYNKVRFESRREALITLVKMKETIEEQWIVTVNDFYKLANAVFHDKKGDACGWMKLDYVKVFKDSIGYYLNLEEPEWY